jgi:hypothetical protein
MLVSKNIGKNLTFVSLNNKDMRNTIYYKWFIESLTEQQKKEYSEMSINQQKDWYISYLENHYING